MSDEQYQTVKKAADLGKVGEATAERWIKDGERPVIDIGKGWRIASSDLDAFLQDHATRPPQEMNGGMFFYEENTPRCKSGKKKGNGPRA
jgi:excisionase family DNA binding protein